MNHIVLCVSLATISTALVVLAPQAQTLPVAHSYFLRVNAPHTPWHNRHLITLPTSHRLGLENFTTHPTTAPLYVQPIALANNVYALRVPDGGDDLSKTPYIAAVEDHRHSYTPEVIGLKTIYASSPVEETDGQVEGCPDEFACVPNAFSVYQNGSRRLAYGGFEGGWKAEKDAGVEGWHIYWVKTSQRGSGAIELEIVARVATFKDGS